MGTEKEIRMLLEGIMLGMLIIWFIQVFIHDRDSKKRTKKLINNMNNLNGKEKKTGK